MHTGGTVVATIRAPSTSNANMVIPHGSAGLVTVSVYEIAILCPTAKWVGMLLWRNSTDDFSECFFRFREVPFARSTEKRSRRTDRDRIRALGPTSSLIHEGPMSSAIPTAMGAVSRRMAGNGQRERAWWSRESGAYHRIMDRAANRAKTRPQAEPIPQERARRRAVLLYKATKGSGILPEPFVDGADATITSALAARWWIGVGDGSAADRRNDGDEGGESEQCEHGGTS